MNLKKTKNKTQNMLSDFLNRFIILNVLKRQWSSRLEGLTIAPELLFFGDLTLVTCIQNWKPGYFT